MIKVNTSCYHLKRIFRLDISVCVSRRRNASFHIAGFRRRKESVEYFVMKLERKRSSGSSTYKWKNNIKTNLREIELGWMCDAERIDIVQGRNECRALVCT